MLDEDEKPDGDMEMAARLREVIAGIPLTKADIAERLGVTAQAITGWETKGRIAKKNLAALSALAGRAPEYLLSGAVGETDADWPDVTGYAQAVGLGDGVEAEEYAQTHKLKFRASSLSRKGLSRQHLAVVYGRGDSMMPRIRAGDAILFDTSDTRPRDETLFVVQTHGIAGGEYSVKRCRHFGDDVYFDALNPEGDHAWRKPRRMDDPRHPITIVGRVRWIGSWED